MVNEEYLSRTIDWRPLFSNSVLKDAQKLVKDGQCQLLATSNSNCKAAIYPSTKSEVTVSVSNAPVSYSDKWSSSRFRCSCKKRYGYYTYQNPYCVHKAAMLLAWEKERGPWEITESEAEHAERVYEERREEERTRREEQKAVEGTIPAPILDILDPRKEDAEPPFFDLYDILKGIDVTVYEINRAREINKAQGVKNLSCTTDFNDHGDRRLCVSASVDDGLRETSTKINITKDKLELKTCTCRPSYWGYSIVSHPCEHVTALLPALEQFLEKENPGDITNYATELFFKTFSHYVPQEQDENSPQSTVTRDIVIEPQLLLDHNDLILGYRIGREGEKMYVLQNLKLLLDAYDIKTTFALGRKVTLDFSQEALLEESEKWLLSIRRKVNEINSINSQLASRNPWGYSPTLSVHSREALSGTELDLFYNATEGEEIDCKHKQDNTTSKIYVGYQPTMIQLTAKTVRNSKNNPIGLEITGSFPLTIYGSESVYVANAERLSRITDEEKACLAPFAKIADARGNICLKIGKHELSEFYYRLLPQLMRNPCVIYKDQCDDDMEAILPPEGEYRFTLDKGDGFITCHATAKYDDQIYDISPDNRSSNAGGYRDKRQERRISDTLFKYFTHHSDEQHKYLMYDDEDADFLILTELVPALSQFGEVFGDSNFHLDRLRRTPKVSVGVSVESDLMNISVLSEGISTEELLKIFKSYQLKKKYYRLDNGDFFTLTNAEGLKELEDISQSMGLTAEELISGKNGLPIYRALYLDKLLEQHDALASNRSRTFRTLVKNFNNIRNADYEVPESLENTLRSYQVYGYKWLHTLYSASFGGILADEMGLGKTIQIISLIKSAKDEGRTAPALVVCPASLVYNWQEEIARFAPDVTTDVIAGGIAARRKCFQDIESDTAADVYITSYDLLRRDAPHYEELHFDIMVIDEAQYIKNPKASQTKAVKAIHALHRFALTGTPIENKLSELWSIFDFLMPGFLYRYSDFQDRFENAIAKNKDKALTERLKQMVSPFILRRLKTDVLKDLPEKLEEVRYAKFDDEQRKLYDGQVIRMKEMINDPDSDKEKIKILAELTRIRQICCDPSLVFERYEGGSAKLDACLDLIDSAIDGGHRTLVFSQFTSMLEIIEDALTKKDIAYLKITGSTPKEKRPALVHEFNNGTIPVFLISLRAGGTGLNLTGADVVIHYDPWWNLAVQNQATDRAHRIGQKNTVTVYKIITKNTIEEKILHMQEAKKDLADAILSGEQTSLMSLSPEELLGLLE